MKVDEFVYGIVRGIVDREDDVRVDVEEAGDGLVLHVSVAPEDVGKLVGRNGQMARALRTVLVSVSRKAAVHYSLNIVEGIPAVAHG